MGGKRIRPILETKKDYVISAYKKGRSIDSLAAEFCCSATPIRHFLIDNGIPFRPAIRPRKLEPFRKEVKSLYCAGASTRQIAEKLNVDRNTVSEFLKSEGIRRAVPLSERHFFITGEINKAILGGLISGDGNISIKGHSVKINLTNTDPEIINWAAQWGGRVYWTKRKKKWKTIGTWQVNGTVDVFHCLNSIHQYLIGKKKKLALKGIELLQVHYGLIPPASP